MLSVKEMAQNSCTVFIIFSPGWVHRKRDLYKISKKLTVHSPSVPNNGYDEFCLSSVIFSVKLRYCGKREIFLRFCRIKYPPPEKDIIYLVVPLQAPATAKAAGYWACSSLGVNDKRISGSYL